MPIHSMVRHCAPARALTLAGMLAPFLLPAPARALSRVPHSLEETVRASDAIFVGRVVSRNSFWADERKKWMWTDVTLQVEDGISRANTGETVTVRYWGGRIGVEAMGVSGLRIPGVNERFVMLLKPVSNSPHISPVVGEVDGLFKVTNSQSGLVVTTAEDGQVALPGTAAPGDETPVAGAQAASPAPDALSLAQFTDWLRANAPTLRTRKAMTRPAGFLPAERIYPGQPEPDAPDAVSPRGAAALPRGEASNESAPSAPTAASEYVPAAAVPRAKGGVSILYNYLGPTASLPITFNQLTPAMAPWSPVDQHQMAKWNYYADVFRISTNPTGTFAWNNNRFDMCGFPSSATMQSQYGAPWDSNTLGVCYWRSVNNVLVEADVSLNPAYSWTLDDEWVFGGGSSRSFRNVMLHELGHAWGLDHNFKGYSVMNYVTQDVAPLLTLPFMDDAEAMRRRYPGATQNVADVAAYLVNLGSPNTDGAYPWWQESRFPYEARADESFEVSGFQMENVGTEAKNVVVEWYLSSARNFDGNYRHLRTVDYGSLPRFYQFNPTTTWLTVPIDIAEGKYYLGTFIRNDGGASQAGFPRSNNSSFTRRTVNIKQKLAYVYPTSITLAPGESATVQATLQGVSAGASLFVSGAPTALNYPASVTVPSGSTSVSFTVTARPTSVPVTATLRTSYGVNMLTTVRVVPPLGMLHVQKALAAAAGLVTLTEDEFDFLDVNRAGESANRVDVLDAAAIARHVTGLSLLP